MGHCSDSRHPGAPQKVELSPPEHSSLSGSILTTDTEGGKSNSCVCSLQITLAHNTAFDFTPPDAVTAIVLRGFSHKVIETLRDFVA